MRLFEHDHITLPELKATTAQNGVRYYETPTGKRYPSITTILGAYKREAIKEWRARVGEVEATKISNRAANRGTAVHDLVERYVNNDQPEISKSMPLVRADFNVITRTLDKWLEKVYCQEATLYSNTLQLAGRVDLIGQFAGKNAVIDFKTKSKPQKEEWLADHHMQCAGYAVMFEEMTGIPVDRTVVICAVENEAQPHISTAKRDDHIDNLIDVCLQFHRGEI